MNHRTTTLLVGIAAIAATLLAAGTVAVLGSNYSAFAHKEYKKTYDKYNREDKDGRDGNNIAISKQFLKCVVVESGGITGNSCNNQAPTNTNNDGVTPPPVKSTCVPSTIAGQTATPTDGTCTAREDGASNSAFVAACNAIRNSSLSGEGANAICTFPSTRA